MADGDDTANANAADVAGQRIRETAKWLTVSLAAIGGVLITGIQFSNLGGVRPWDARFIAIVAGAALALAGVGSLLSGAIRTAVTPTVSLTRLATAFRGDATESQRLHNAVQKANAHLQADVALLGGFKSFLELAERYCSVVESRASHATAYYDKDGQDATLKTQLESDQAEVKFLGATVINVLKLASYNLLTRRWKQMQTLAAIGGVLAVLGVGLFTWGANPPEMAKASLATPAIVSTPTSGKLTLTQAGREALVKALGADCPLTMDLDVLKLGETGAGPDVLVQTGNCSTARLVLTPAWGQVTVAR